MFCQKCGVKLADGATVCTGCGTPTAPVPQVSRADRPTAATSESSKPQLTAAPFILAVLCFFLPFIHVSCGRDKVVSVTGVQLVLGSEAGQPGLFGGQARPEKVDREPLAVAAIACAGVATLFCLAVSGSARILPALTGAAGLVCLLLMKKKFDDQVLREAAGMFTVDAGLGFTLAVILLGVGAGLCLYYSRELTPSTEPANNPPSSGTGGAGPPQPGAAPVPTPAAPPTAGPPQTTALQPATLPGSGVPKLSPATLGSGAMILFFFLPWAQLLGQTASGYQLQQLGSYGNLAWLVPVFASLTILMGYYGKRQTDLAQLTGALPLLGLIYGLVKVGTDLFQLLGVGAYLTLLTGLFLLFVNPQMKQK